MTSSRKHFVLLVLSVITSGICSANLPTISGTNKTQTGITNIYIPRPSMMGLNKPATPIRQTGPLQNRIYGHPGISSPGAYNHYRYLYSTYNYRRMAYPYLAYYGRGSRNPGYFNFNRRPSGSESKPKNPELKFNGARIINTKSSLEDKSEGRYSAKQFLKLWVKAAGPFKAPPSIQNGEIAVYLNSPLDQDIRIITKVDTEGDDENISKFLVHYETRKPPKESSTFYSIDGQKPKGFMSAAIFAFRDRPIELILAGSEETESEEEQDSVTILWTRTGACELVLSEYKKHEGSNITRNYTLRSGEDVSRLERYFKLKPKESELIRKTNWERELVYLTGRIYPHPDNNFDRMITDVYEWREKNKSTQIKHYVEITEPIRSRETFDLDSIEPSESNNLTFNYHWVRVAKPRNFGGLRTFSIKSSKE